MNERLCRMAAESNTVNIYPKEIDVEFDPLDMGLPNAIMNAKRLCEYMAAQEVKITNEDTLVGKIKFDKTVVGDTYTRNGYTHFRKFADEFYQKPCENLASFDAQHSTGDFKYVLENGIEGLINKIENSMEKHKENQMATEYLHALKMVCDGIVAWENKCADKCLELAKDEINADRKAQLTKMEKTIRCVPLKPAKSFYEAIQSLYFCWHFVPDSLGLPDRYLYKYYIADINNGNISREEAKELMQELFITINGWTSPENKWSADKGGESHFSIGGYDANGNDVYNELSQLIVESIMELPLYRPQISLRWTKKTTTETLKYIMDCERKDEYKRIAIVNDSPRIDALVNISNIPYNEAVNYAMVGCNEPAIPGNIWADGIAVNIARSIEKLFHTENGNTLSKCKTFAEFYSLYEKILSKEIERAVFYANTFERARSKDIDVLSSLFFNGPIENGKSVTQGGMRYCMTGMDMIGITCVIDSLTVVKQFVYDKKLFEMQALTEALKNNWQGYEDIRNLILKKTDFFGNNKNISDDIAILFNNSVSKILSNFKSLNGGHFVCGSINGYCPYHAWFGSNTKATPDGRYDGEAYMIGIGQSSGKDREGLTALMNSVANMNPTGVFSGATVCNAMLDEALVNDDEKFDKLVSVVETYLKSGGIQIQFNYVSRETLINAQDNPEKYQNLRVRVSGFSAYFVGLDKSLQDEIIKRTKKEV